MRAPTDPKELAALIEQLRHACSVAFGDLLAQGMPPGVSTGRLLQAAIVAAEEYLAQTEAEEGNIMPAVRLQHQERVTMTALQWMTRFDHVQPKRMGRSNGMYWMHTFAWKVGEPGETPHYFLMERASGEVRAIKNLSSEECALAMMDPPSFWDHPAAEELKINDAVDEEGTS